MDKQLYQLMQDLIEVEKEFEELRLEERKVWKEYDQALKSGENIEEKATVYYDNSKARQEKNQELTELKASIIMIVRSLYFEENRK